MQFQAIILIFVFSIVGGFIIWLIQLPSPYSSMVDVYPTWIGVIHTIIMFALLFLTIAWGADLCSPPRYVFDKQTVRTVGKIDVVTYGSQAINLNLQLGRDFEDGEEVTRVSEGPRTIFYNSDVHYYDEEAFKKFEENNYDYDGSSNR